MAAVDLTKQPAASWLIYWLNAHPANTSLPTTPDFTPEPAFESIAFHMRVT